MSKQQTNNPESGLFDKYDAAKYLGSTPYNVFYHHYYSGKLKGGQIRFGRLTWTKAQLDEFKAAHPHPNFKSRAGVHSITVAEFVKNPEYYEQLRNKTHAFTYQGTFPVLAVMRDKENTRLYNVTLLDTDEQEHIYQFWNNARLEIEPIKKEDSE